MRGWIFSAVALCAWAALASSCGEQPPAIDRVLIDGNLFSNQVRQGVGPISFIVTGRGLQYVTSASLEDLPVTVRSGVPDGGVTLDTVIPHATLPGTRSLTLTLADNRPILTQAAVVEVTTIRATAQGDDAVGRGTPEHPFRTLTKALSLSATGDEVDLGEGTYGLVAGERWPAESGLPPAFTTANVPDGVVIKGAGSAVTLLDGSGLLGSAAALIFTGGGSVEGMTLKTFHRGVLAGRGLVNVTDVAASGCTAEGFIVSPAGTLRLTSSAASGCATGARALGSSSLFADNSGFSGNGVGLEFDDSSRGTVSAAGISGNTGAGVVVASRGDIVLNGITVDQNGQTKGVDRSSGIFVTGTPYQLHLAGGTLSRNGGSGLYALGGTLDLSQVTVTGNALDGITLDGASQAALYRTGISGSGRDGVQVTAASGTSLTIDQSTLSTNAGNGVWVGSGTATVRASTIDNNGLNGLRVTGQGALALPWTAGQDPQADVVLLPPGSINACLSDERAASAASAVSVVHASLNGTIIPSGLVAGPVDARPQYRIVSPGNQINFLQ